MPACVLVCVLTVSLKETVGCGSLLTRDRTLLSLPTDWHCLTHREVGSR